MPGKEKNQNTEEMCMEGKNFERRKAGEDKLKEKDPLAWEEIRTDHIIQDEWIDFRKTSYRFPDGSIYEPFYSYSRRDYVVIVASDPEGRYL